MIRPIVLWPDAGLKRVSLSVGTDFGDLPLVVDQLLTDLFETMYEHHGAGLSAIQLGVPLRVFVMDCGTGLAYAFINPRLVSLQGTPCKVREGCLSLPNLFDEVERYPEVIVEALDQDGKLFAQHFEGLEAQCVQHEYDHLDGVVFPDKLSPLKRARLASKMAKRKRRTP
jgi:peptide deformylase